MYFQVTDTMASYYACVKVEPVEEDALVVPKIKNRPQKKIIKDDRFDEYPYSELPFTDIAKFNNFDKLMEDTGLRNQFVSSLRIVVTLSDFNSFNFLVYKTSKNWWKNF